MIAIISDVHGNYEALKVVLKKIEQLEIKKIFCLGDVVGYYSQVNECCDALREKKVKCVMGNHDWYMTSGSRCLRSQSVNDCLEYQRKVITKQNKEWISNFPVIINYKDISMVHGGWINPIDEYIEPANEYFENIDAKIFVSGHTHIQQYKEFETGIYCNPGSVGQPRDGDNTAAFATYDGKKFQFHREAYDIDTVGKLMDKVGFGKYYYGCLMDASRRLHE